MNVRVITVVKLLVILVTVNLTACMPDPANALIEIEAHQAIVYYQRDGADYDGWGLHLWDDIGSVTDEVASATSWSEPLLATGIHPLYGAYYIIDLRTDDWADFKFIVHQGDSKDLGGADHVFSRAVLSQDVFTFQGVGELFPEPLLEAPVLLSGASAHFIDIANPGGASLVYKTRSTANSIALWHSPTAALKFDAESKSVSGGTPISMTPTTMSPAQKAAYPHLASFDGYGLDATAEDAKNLVKDQLWTVESNAAHEVVRLTRVQTAPLLDRLYYEAAQDATLGAFNNAGHTQFSLWAPTAQEVSVKVYDSQFALVRTVPLTEDSATGIWSVSAPLDLTGHYYRYKLTLFHYASGAIECLEVTDPYSLSLALNSTFSQVVDLGAEALLPAGWQAFEPSNLVNSEDMVNPEDMAIYEAHIRDLSIADTTKVDAAADGKYLAFTDASRESMRHLQALRAAGMTAIQILPAFDIATIDEDASARVDIDDSLADYCAISSAAQAKALELGLTCDSTLISAALASLNPTTGAAQDFYVYLRPQDSFNWGYDPFHYTVPEGSYSSDPSSMARILEFRAMVQALHDMDFRVVMDVVYNHTNASGLAAKSVLDKVVPGYYHRRDVDSGVVTRDSCCDDTATEHKMMAKLMTDSLVVWADQYHIDAFRFDLMGLQTKVSMEQALVAVQAVNPAIYFYGEGWDYGAAGQNKRGTNASQSNIAGTGIGTFTDRLRDGIRGGGPFDELGDSAGEDSLRRNQGLANSAIPNELNWLDSFDPDAGTANDNQLTPDLELAAAVLSNADIVRIGLAGNLKRFVLTNSHDDLVNGTQIDYKGQPAAYADDPQEIINYVSKHDNQTLWDIIAYKAANTVSSADRARMQSLAVATGTYAQGVPFYHLGVDLLRSKSMERDSYDSGDWFNRVDFAKLADSNWHVGLPREDKDAANWPFIQQVTANPDANPSVADVDWMRQSFQEMLSIRADSPLFRLTSAAEVINRVAFHNTGSSQTAGLIAMSIDDGVHAGNDLDAQYDALMVVFNYTDMSHQVVVPDAADFELHAIQQASADSSVQSANFALIAGEPTFHVPALTAAVFVLPQNGAQGDGLPAGDVPPFGTTTLYAVGAFSNWAHRYDGYYIGEDRYEFPINLPSAGTFDFRFADKNWASSTNADSFSNGPGSAFTLTASGDSDNNFLLTVAPSQAGDYRIQLDLRNPVPVITISAANFDLGADMYLMGTLLTPNWSPLNAGLLAYRGAGDYRVRLDASPGDYSFKVADAGWSNGTNFGAGSTNSLTLGTAMELDGIGDIAISIPVAGVYNFSLDTGRSVSVPSLTVAAYPEMFVRGDMNGWSTADRLSYDGMGRYSATLTLDVGRYGFKFSNEDWSNAFGFGSSQDPGSIVLTDNGGNLLLDVTVAGDYHFRLDAIGEVIGVTLVP